MGICVGTPQAPNRHSVPTCGQLTTFIEYSRIELAMEEKASICKENLKLIHLQFSALPFLCRLLPGYSLIGFLSRLTFKSAVCPIIIVS